MEILRPIADLFGISPTMLLVLTLLGVLLVGGWYFMRFTVRMAWKTFVSGCALIALLIGGLLVGMMLLNLVQ